MVCIQCQVTWPDNNRICQYCGQPLQTEAQATLNAVPTPDTQRNAVMAFLIVFFIELRKLTFFEYATFLGLIWLVVHLFFIFLIGALY